MGVPSPFSHLLTPNYIFTCVEDIDLAAWWQAGLRGIILDVDDTLTRKNSPHVAEPVLLWLQQAQTLGFQCLIVSNNHYPTHIEEIASRLGIAAIARARKPRAAGFNWALQQMNLTPQQVVVVGDRMLTDILGGAFYGLQTCLVSPVTRQLSAPKRCLYMFEKWLRQTLGH